MLCHLVKRFTIAYVSENCAYISGMACRLYECLPWLKWENLWNLHWLKISSVILVNHINWEKRFDLTQWLLWGVEVIILVRSSRKNPDFRQLSGKCLVWCSRLHHTTVYGIKFNAGWLLWQVCLIQIFPPRHIISYDIRLALIQYWHKVWIGSSSVRYN